MDSTIRTGTWHVYEVVAKCTRVGSSLDCIMPTKIWGSSIPLEPSPFELGILLVACSLESLGDSKVAIFSC